MKTVVARIQQTILFIAGVLLTLVGGYILSAPTGFFAANNIELGGNASLINELKAPAGMLLVAGVVMISSTFVRSLTDSATWLAALIYLSYAVSRSLSMAIDGLPSTGLVQAAALEALVGLACLTVLLIRQRQAWKIA